ncbi:MAG: helix-turn-helix transcriptional regulator, partial [Muribaculaceae bacterium]|nr:helix-turn-helix transcriptional regulator [Muribaculaceae bacterium]
MSKSNLDSFVKDSSDSCKVTRMHVDLDRFKEISKPESECELAVEKELNENGDLYKASMRIAMKVKRALRIAGITQAVLAEKMGMDPAVISKSLNGKANLELKTLVKLEKALGITIIDRSISKPLQQPIYSFKVFTKRKDMQVASVAYLQSECFKREAKRDVKQYFVNQPKRNKVYLYNV